jgi:hypothetical protein
MAREYSQSGRESNGPRAAISRAARIALALAAGHGGEDKLRLCFAEI